jgi:DnaK suppressor protein
MKTREKKSRKKAKKTKSDLRAMFMQNIMDKRKELEKTVERLIDNQKEYDVQFRGGDLIDELDQAQREISASSYYPIIERKIKELRKIDLLIKRMSKEEIFGLCEECGKQIPKKRLLIVPEATLCVSCQRELEKTDLWRSVEARASVGYGGGEAMDLDSDDYHEKGRLAIKTQINTFSINDIRGTETDHDLATSMKGH